MSFYDPILQEGFSQIDWTLCVRVPWWYDSDDRIGVMAYLGEHHIFRYLLYFQETIRDTWILCAMVICLCLVHSSIPEAGISMPHECILWWSTMRSPILSTHACRECLTDANCPQGLACSNTSYQCVPGPRVVFTMELSGYTVATFGPVQQNQFCANLLTLSPPGSTLSVVVLWCSILCGSVCCCCFFLK